MKKNKQKNINLRVTEEQKNYIKMKAANLGMSVSQYLLELADKGQIHVIEGGHELVELIYELNSKLSRMEKYPAILVQDLNDVIGESVRHIRRQIRWGK